MRSLYLSQQGSRVTVRADRLTVQQGDEPAQTIALPLLDQILVFGNVQLTTQVLRACLVRDVPVVYLSRMGYCHGRLTAIHRGYRALARHQADLSFGDRLLVARAIVANKLHNSRILLQRYRQRGHDLGPDLDQFRHLGDRARQATSLDALFGLEGAGAAAYFGALRSILADSGLGFRDRNRRPPQDPINAFLSFGYQVLWNHLLVLVELQGLDPYAGCLHEPSDRHPALVSDLLEEFRAPLVDAVVLGLVNRGQVDRTQHTEQRDGGCFLNEAGRKLYLQAFIDRMEGAIDQDEGGSIPRWELLSRQVRAYKQFVYQPVYTYQPYRLRT